MSSVPSELRYTESHEWVRLDENGDVVVGITDHAQKLLGDLVYVELPEVDSEVRSGDEAGVVESVKAASDLYSPVDGVVVAINDAVSETPELLNKDPYGDGWVFKVKPSNENELTELLDADTYAEQIAEA